MQESKQDLEAEITEKHCLLDLQPSYILQHNLRVLPTHISINHQALSTPRNVQDLSYPCCLLIEICFSGDSSLSSFWLKRTMADASFIHFLQSHNLTLNNHSCVSDISCQEDSILYLQMTIARRPRRFKKGYMKYRHQEWVCKTLLSQE